MDKLIEDASVSLAKAGMDRRGFLGKLALAATGAGALSVLFASGVSADHCSGSHFCETSRSIISYCGGSCSYNKKTKELRQEGKDCYTGASCPALYSFYGCGSSGSCP